MRSFAATVLIALIAAVGAADEITVEKILSAHSFGAPAESIISQITNEANTVAPVSTEDLVRLKSAGVPDSVIQALLARTGASAAPAAQAPQGPQPDDTRLINIVKVVKSGLSEALIAEHIKRSGERYNLTVNDLLYLRTNLVPEAVIGAFLATSATTTSQAPSGATVTTPVRSAPQEETEVSGLVLRRATFLKKDRQGRMVFKGDELTWVDAEDSAESFSVRASGITKAYMRCQARPQTPFCYELVIEIFKGDTYKFQDSGLASGINDHVLALRQVFKERYPNVLISERVD